MNLQLAELFVKSIAVKKRDDLKALPYDDYLGRSAPRDVSVAGAAKATPAERPSSVVRRTTRKRRPRPSQAVLA